MLQAIKNLVYPPDAQGARLPAHPPSLSWVQALRSLAQHVKRLRRDVDALQSARQQSPPTLPFASGVEAELRAEIDELRERLDRSAEWARTVKLAYDAQRRELAECRDLLDKCLAQQQRWYLSQRGVKNGAAYAATHRAG